MSKYDDEANESDNEDLLVCKIVSMEGFVDYLRKMAWEQFTVKVSNHFKNKNDIKKINLSTDDVGEEDLPLVIIMQEIRRFAFYDKEEEETFILRNNIQDIIKTLANQIISNFLGRLVDTGVLDMCWDSKFNEFIWQIKPKPRKKPNIDKKRKD